MIDHDLRQEAEAVFNDIMDAPRERQAELLDARCGSRHALRQEVERLLNATDEVMREFMRAPRIGPVAAPERIGRYRIEQLLGEGGMGLVFAARQQNPDRLVALKLLRPGLISASLLRRFQHEIEALASLQHPGIAQIYEAGSTEIAAAGRCFEQPFFAMELIHGPPLTHYARDRRLTTRERLLLLAEVCDAVQHAHQKGIIHRDLKPANILVDEAGRPRVLDFGVARLSSAADIETLTQHTSAGQLVGTLAYMSPEQLSGDPAALDTRSDVYALGVIAFELLADRLPFELKGLTIPAAIRAIAETEPLKIGLQRPHLRGDIEAIVARAMAREPERRYPSAAELASDIRRHLAHEPVTARRAGAMYHLRKFARRHRAVVAGASLALAALLAGAAATAAFAVRAGQEAESARRNANSADAAVTFLREMFASVDPALSRGRNVSVREMIDAAAARLADESAYNEPQVRATLHSMIGTAYLHLGDAATARPHFEKSIELLRRIHGPVHRTLPENLTSLAEAVALLGELELATQLDREALEITERLYGPRSPEVAMALGDLGVSLSRVGKEREAEELHRRSLEIRRADPHTRPALLAQGLSNLGSVLITLGPPEEAESVLREALQLRREVLPPDHPDLATSLNNLSIVLKERGQVAEAESLLREALQIWRRILTPGHPRLAATLNNLATVLQRDGRDAESVPFLEEAIEIVRAGQAPDHPDVARSLLNLASAQFNAGDEAGAERTAEQALAILRAAFGEDGTAVAAALNNVSAMQVSRGALEPAVARLRVALQIFEQRLGPANTNTAHVRDTLGVALNGLERFVEATPLLEQALADRRAAFGDHEDRVARTQMNLAMARLGTGRPQEAAQLAASAGSTLRTLPRVELELSTALLIEAEALLEAGDAVPDPAKSAEALQLRRALFDEGSWQIAEALRVRGRCLARAGDYPTAESDLRCAFQAFENAPAPRDPRAAATLRKTIAALVELYDASGQADLAAEWRARQ